MCQSDDAGHAMSCLVCHNLLPWVDHQVDVPSSHHECVDISTWSASHCWMMMLGRGARCCGGGNGCVWRCWDGAMMCDVISPVTTGKDCFPVNRCVKCLFDMLYIPTDRIFGTSCVTWSQSLWGTWGVADHMIFSIYRFSSWFEMFVILICVRMWLFMMISSTS